MSGIGIILNPHSRSNRRNPERINRLGFIVGDKGACKATKDITDLAEIAREFKERGIEILGISGGDGTNHCTLSTFLDVYGETPLPTIAFLRGGTMNNIANALDIHGSPEQILSNLILKYHEDQPFETTEVDMMNINGKYGFLFGNGLVSRFIEEYYKSNKPGPARALGLLIKTWLSAFLHTRHALKLCERFDARVVVDGKEWDFKNYIFIDAGTIETFGMGFKPFYRARTKPRHFQIMGGSMTPRAILAVFPRMFLGKPPKSENYQDDLACEADIYFDKPQNYNIDGDMQPATDHINITAGPRLTVIVR